MFWGLLAIVALGLLLLVRPGDRPGRNVTSGAKDPLVGKQLAVLRFEPLTGDGKSLGLADLKGNVTLVNFWGTWCPPCLEEFPALEKLRSELASDPEFRFVSVSCWQGIETDIDRLRSETAGFLQTRRSDLPTCYDPDARTRIAILDLLGVNGMGYPMTLLFDRQGTIRGVWHGYERGMEADVRSVTLGVLKELSR